jgi:hypothetical protein
MTDEIIEAVGKMKAFPLATASKDGIPNVAPMGAYRIKDSETIWIQDNFMNKTLAIVEENPKAAVYIYGDGAKGCYQIKADVIVKKSGPELEEMKAYVEERKPGLPGKGLLILKVTGVFQCRPGPEAGKQLL